MLCQQESQWWLWNRLYILMVRGRSTCKWCTLAGITQGFGLIGSNRFSVSRQCSVILAAGVCCSGARWCAGNSWHSQRSGASWDEHGRACHACLDGGEEECAEGVAKRSGLHLRFGNTNLYIFIICSSSLSPCSKSVL